MGRSREYSLRFDMTGAEKAHLKRAAADAGKTMSEYVRDIIKEPPPVTQQQFEQQICKNVQEIHKIGVNINQIARRYNAMEIPYASEELLKRLTDLEKDNQELTWLLKKVLVQLNS